QEGAAGAVKLEGGQEVAATVQAMTQAGIPVMGHLGLTPQAVYQMGGYQVQGKSESAALKLWRDAQALQQAGVFALVLECVPAELARFITQKLDVVVIGIGGGVGCDGQVLVVNDLLGFYSGQSPKFSKRYLDLNQQIAQAFAQYKQEVENQIFPAAEHEFSIDPAVVENLSRYEENGKKGN
ncbi:MAG: 3-methyl-2-oxobutanoate hydroxymethyltransferase, partial [Clostridia bacterium]|nr:3-methyl-2-oxobutanoate hydroxymethyltransferase [Clostridia bacterium]